MITLKERIQKTLEDGKNVAINGNVEKYTDLVGSEHEILFLEYVNPAKEVAAEILSRMTKTAKNTIYKKYTTNEIVQEIKRKTKNTNTLIIFNDLQGMSKSTMRIFLDIMETTQIFCSIRGKTAKHHERILKKIVFIKSEEEFIDITIPLIIFAGMIAFLVYLKTAVSLQGVMAYMLLASVWFGLIIARTILWIK